MIKHPTQFFLLLLTFNLFLLLDLKAQIDKSQLLEDLKILSSDAYAGRLLGENEKARNYLLDRVAEYDAIYAEKVDTFRFMDRLKKIHTGHNVIVQVKGTRYPDKYLVLSAHYDHVGIQGGEIYNGADDNASGTAALLALLPYFQSNPIRHSIIFAFFDAEERGLKGADRFTEDPPVPLEQILMNINLDMIGRNDENTINICGTYQFPELTKPLEKVIRKTDLIVTKKHEGPAYKGGDNWTRSSDHAPFADKDIPYLYFGVEDHPGYHQPSDDFEFINQDFFVQVVDLVQKTTERFDRKLKKKARKGVGTAKP